MKQAALAAQEPIMPSDPSAAPRAASPPPTPAPSAHPPDAGAPDDTPDADAAEPVAHERLPIRSDDN